MNKINFMEYLLLNQIKNKMDVYSICGGQKFETHLLLEQLIESLVQMNLIKMTARGLRLTLLGEQTLEQDVDQNEYLAEILMMQRKVSGEDNKTQMHMVSLTDEELNYLSFWKEKLINFILQKKKNPSAQGKEQFVYFGQAPVGNVFSYL